MRFDIEDIRRAAHVDPSRNGAPLYRKAFAGIDPIENRNRINSKSANTLDRYPFSVNMRNLIDEMDPQGQLLADIQTAARAPDVDWGRTWLAASYDSSYYYGSEDSEYLAPSPDDNETSKLTKMAGLLSGVAMIEARDGAPERAVGRIRDAFHIGQHVGREPFQGALSAQAVVEQNVCRALAFVLDQKPGEKALEAARTVVAGLAPPTQLRTSLCYGLAESLRQIDLDEAEAEKRRGTNEAFTTDFPGSLIYQYPTFGQARRAKAIHYARLAFEQIGTNPTYHDYQFVERSIAELLGSDQSRAAWQSGNASLPVGLYRCRVYRRLTLASIDLLLIRARTGRLPNALPSGDEFVDPYTDKPFVFKRHGSGFEIYSLGSNEQDDSAKPKWHKDQDIVFAFR